MTRPAHPKTAGQLADFMCHHTPNSLPDTKRAVLQTMGSYFTNKTPPPLAIKLFSFAGIGIVSLLLLVSIAMSIPELRLPSVYTWLGFGGVLLFLAIGLKRMHNYSNSLMLQQLTIILLLSGKAAIIFGVAILFQPYWQWPVTITAFALTSITWFWFQSTTDQFVSSLSTIALLTDNISLTFGEASIPIYIITLLIAVFYLVSNLHIRHHFTMLIWVLILTIGWLVVSRNYPPLILMPNIFQYLTIQIMILQASLFAAFMVLALRICAEMNNTSKLVIASCSIGIGAMIFVAPPMFTLAAMVIVLAYAIHDRYLLWLGIAALPVSIFSFYYTLSQTLLTKSILLTATGLLALAAAAFIHRMEWNQVKSHKEDAK